MSKLLAFALLLLAASAQASSTPAGVVQRGLDAYLKGDAVAAVKGWLEGSALEGNPQASTQANSLRQVEDFYGKPESYQLLGEHQIAERARMIYFAVNYTKGVAFLRFQVYRLASGQWVSTEFRFHTDANQVLPAHLAVGAR